MEDNCEHLRGGESSGIETAQKDGMERRERPSRDERWTTRGLCFT